MKSETRFRMVEKMDKSRFDMLVKQHEADIKKKIHLYKQLAQLTCAPTLQQVQG
jgi:hypothetical protein